MMKQLLNNMTRTSTLPVPEVPPTSSVASSCTDTPLPCNLPTPTSSSSDVSNHHDSMTHDTSVPSVAFPSTVPTHLPSHPPCFDLLPQLCDHAPTFCQLIDPLLFPDHFMSTFFTITYAPLRDHTKFTDHPT